MTNSRMDCDYDLAKCCAFLRSGILFFLLLTLMK